MPLTRQVPWPRLLAEGAVIVFSILLAFGIDAWWDWKQDRRREHDALTRLDAELVQVELVLQRWQAHHIQVRDASQVLLENMGPSGPPLLSEDSIAKLISPMRFEWTVDPPLATLASLESSGQLATIRSQELLTQLASWRATLLDLQKDEENLRQRLASHFVPFLQARIAYRSLGPGSASQWRASTFPSDLRGLLRNREFEGMVDEQLDRASTNVANYDEARTGLAQLRSLIQEQLAR